MPLGELLRATREAQGLSVAEAARRSGLTPAAIAAAEGERWRELPPPARFPGLDAYADALGVPRAQMRQAYARAYRRPPRWPWALLALPLALLVALLWPRPAPPTVVLSPPPAREQVVRLSVGGEPAGAQVLVNNRLVGRLPLRGYPLGGAGGQLTVLAPEHTPLQLALPEGEDPLRLWVQLAPLESAQPSSSGVAAQAGRWRFFPNP